MEVDILCCEESLEGVFTAIYEAYERKWNPENTKLQFDSCGELQLFARYTESLPDAVKTGKVVHTLQKTFGTEVYYMLCQALASYHEDRADAVYHAIAEGLKMQNKNQFMTNLSHPAVCRVFELSRSVNNEILHLKGFLRFKELENGILFATIGPKNNILTFLAPHFADRFGCEDFVIYDETRNLTAIHPKGRGLAFVSADYLDPEVYEAYSDKEREYQQLFRHFCHKISIKERENKNLQRQMLPLRFRDYMVEF